MHSVQATQIENQNVWSTIAEKFWRWFIEPARRRKLYHTTVRELQSLDDRMLRDIGVHRSEISALAYGCAYGNDHDTERAEKPHAVANDNDYRGSASMRETPSTDRLDKAA